MMSAPAQRCEPGAQSKPLPIGPIAAAPRPLGGLGAEGQVHVDLLAEHVGRSARGEMTGDLAARRLVVLQREDPGYGDRAAWALQTGMDGIGADHRTVRLDLDDDRV